MPVDGRDQRLSIKMPALGRPPKCNCKEKPSSNLGAREFDRKLPARLDRPSEIPQ